MSLSAFTWKELALIKFESLSKTTVCRPDFKLLLPFAVICAPLTNKVTCSGLVEMRASISVFWANTVLARIIEMEMRMIFMFFGIKAAAVWT